MRTELRFACAAVIGSLLAAACSGDSGTTSGTTGGPDDKCGPAGGKPEAIPDPAIHTPRWAFEPWISKDISTGADTYELVAGFAERDIPVGAVVLDSPWETHYNTFVPHPTRYPELPKLVSDMHEKGVRVVLWITPLVNSTSYDLEKGGDSYEGASPNQDQGYTCGFFVNEGAEYSWWKGKGAAVDFFNANAAAWWHSQQEGVLSAGIDGWKLDFGESYINVDTVKTAAGDVSHQEYSEAYYKDFLAFGVHRRGKDFLTMVRAWDGSYGFEGRFHARPEHAPVSWMGDNRRDWVGLADVLDSMFRSAAAGYVVLGSDIGGYLDRDDKDLLGDEIPLDPVNFMRWTALSALTPFMQLHGRANLTPWTFPEMADEVVSVYRYWAKLHHELVPFFYSLAEEAYSGEPGIVRPIGAEKDWPLDYRYELGSAFLVAPLLDGSGVRDVALPAGTRWYDWWAPDAAALEGGQTLANYDSSDLVRLPLFVRAGAIVPVEVGDATTGLGTAASSGQLTALIYPDTKATTFRLHDTDDAVTTLETATKGAGFTVSLSRALRDTLLRVRAEAAPTTVTVDGAAAPELADRAAFDAAKSGWFHEATTRSVWVRVPAGDGAHTVEGG